MKASVRSAVRGHACVVALLFGISFACGNVNAQTVRVVAANSANSVVYDVNFVDGAVPGGSTTPINTDQSLHTSIRSVVLQTNIDTLALDVLAADTLRDTVLRFRSATPATPAAAEVIWRRGDGVAGPNPLGLLGPLAPNGLALDSANNLFVVSSAPGASVSQALWVFKRNPARPSGFDLPRLVDSDFGGSAVEELQETMVSKVKVGPIDFDFLLIAATPARIMYYPATAIQSVLAGSGEVDPQPLISTAALGANEPAGLDFWPSDNSLLISTAGGNVLRFDVAANSFGPSFATGLGNGKFKIKTAVEFGEPRAFVADRNGGKILKFGPPNGASNPPLASVASGVQSPHGLAVTNAGLADARDCLESRGGCDALGGVVTHQVRGTVNNVAGTLLQTPCVVHVDPRGAGGACSSATIDLADVCPGFESVAIPPHLCGAAGPDGSAFAVVRTYAPGIQLTDGIFVSEVDGDAVLPGPVAPCPMTVVGWAPIPSSEAPSVAGPLFEELTGACGSSTSFTRRGSYFFIGSLNVSGLPGTTTLDKLSRYAVSKYERIGQVVAVSTIRKQLARDLTNCLSQSQRSFDRRRYLNALGELVACDSLVAANPSAFTSTPSRPNPSGEIRGRLANLYLTIDARILGNAPLPDWPPGN